jgi:hypothetical protein
MNAQQAENLRILIRHMETNVARVLDMQQTIRFCGTPACAIGEAYVCVPVLRDQFPDGAPRGGNYGTLADRLFGVTFRLFGTAPSAYSTREESRRYENVWGSNAVTPQQWAKEARKVLAENGYAMDDGFAAFKAKILAPLTETV